MSVTFTSDIAAKIMPMSRLITHSRIVPVVLAALAVLAGVPLAIAQQTPLISGGVGFFTNTNGGSTTYVPSVVPVLEAPVGSHLLFESRANLLESFFPKGAGQGYDTFHFVAVSYAQADYLLTSHATVVAGYYLTPFGTYNERLSPIWISNLQDAPLITALGTMGSGSGLGVQLRGNLHSTSKISIDYATYFSAHSSNEQVVATRSSGARVDFYLPEKRLEVGFSYGRRLEGSQANFYGSHVWWQPARIPLKIRSEFAHAHNAQGYWIETDYRLSQIHGPESLIGRLEPVFRMQQTFRRNPDVSDGLPSEPTQRADFGLDYHLPHELRINSSYARQFSASGNKNVWETGLVYRFLFPAWKGR